VAYIIFAKKTLGKEKKHVFVADFAVLHAHHHRHKSVKLHRQEGENPLKCQVCAVDGSFNLKISTTAIVTGRNSKRKGDLNNVITQRGHCCQSKRWK
jgi:hypothetical protein